MLRGSDLFDGDALGEIAGLVDVGAFHAGHVIGEELHRYGIDERGNQRMDLRHFDGCDAAFTRFGDALMHRLMAAGEEFGVIPYGTEALTVMRIEKGHISGPELNGTTTPGDVGLGGMASKKKDYIGRALLERPGLTDETRPSLVGLRPVDKSQRLRSGAHLIAEGASVTAANDEGYVTSVAYSPSNRHWIALALLAGGPKRTGEIVRACDPLRGEEIRVEVVAPIFYDPEGGKLRG